MKELLEEEDKHVVATTTVSEKKKQSKKEHKERAASRQDAADGQDGSSQKEEHTEDQKDEERTETKTVSQKKTTDRVATVTIEATFKDKVDGVGTSHGIQGRGLSQEKDDDDGLPDESSVKRKNKSKKKRAGDQGPSPSKTTPWDTETKEADTATTGVGVETKSWSPPLQADVERAAISFMSCAATTCEGEKLFMTKFNLSRLDTSSGEVLMTGSRNVLGPAAVPEETPAPSESMSRAASAPAGAGPRYTYQSRSIATNNFLKRLVGGGCGSVL
jgi:hypothetical protein